MLARGKGAATEGWRAPRGDAVVGGSRLMRAGASYTPPPPPAPRPGDTLYCRLSVNTQLLAKVDQLMKVGKNNFKPPPKVESRVVRIETRQPPPPVDFVEWDGLVRLAFNRKNKKLRSVLTSSTVLELLEKNARTAAAVTGAPLPAAWTPRAAVDAVLAEVGMQDKRGAKCSIDDFLTLLAAFGRAGVHFKG